MHILIPNLNFEPKLEMCLKQNSSIMGAIEVKDYRIIIQ